MNGCEPVRDNIAEIAGDMQQRRATNQRLVRRRNTRNTRAEARAENSQRPIAARFQPAQTAARIADGLPVRLQRKPYVRADNVVSSRMPGNRALVVVRQTESQRGDPEPIEPAADVHMRRVVSVPLWKDDD